MNSDSFSEDADVSCVDGDRFLCNNNSPPDPYYYSTTTRQNKVEKNTVQIKKVESLSQYFVEEDEKICLQI